MAVPGNVIGEQVGAIPVLRVRILHNHAEALEALEPGMFKSNRKLLQRKYRIFLIMWHSQMILHIPDFSE